MLQTYSVEHFQKKVKKKKMFYEHYYGHKIADLETLTSQFRRLRHNIVFLVGDSTLDNKHWILDEPRQPTHPGYQCVMPRKTILDESVPDIAYWIHHTCQYHRMACINAAVEEATLSSKASTMNPQDVFVMNNLRPDDILVVSIGGNDIALRPTMGTVMAMASLMLQPMFLLGHYNPTMMYLRGLFQKNLETYLQKLTHFTKPRFIIVCFLYFPDENAKAQSWANSTLHALGYNSNPKTLQDRMRLVFESCVTKVKVEGCRIQFLPFYEVLDGKTTLDYAQRVEPSSSGGRKIAKRLLEKMI